MSNRVDLKDSNTGDGVFIGDLGARSREDNVDLSSGREDTISSSWDVVELEVTRVPFGLVDWHVIGVKTGEENGEHRGRGGDQSLGDSIRLGVGEGD